MKVFSIFSGSALIGAALLTGSLMLSARTLSAEPLSSQTQQPKVVESPSIGSLGGELAAEEAHVVPPTSYVATAYSLRGRTASGRMVAKGLIAGDPRHLPLGTRVRLEAGAYSGEYLVADTGALIRGKRIDIWTPSSREAMRFGRRTVKLTVLSFPNKKRVSQKI